MHALALCEALDEIDHDFFVFLLLLFFTRGQQESKDQVADMKSQWKHSWEDPRGH